ncbi:hypothetical protein T492DRAFT_935642 [Pavlovales sp. CCMP2436]|nr:hypothetical protein T492DRAFT_935642 [Pavlovales sp. CCMP2436]
MAGLSRPQSMAELFALRYESVLAELVLAHPTTLVPALCLEAHTAPACTRVLRAALDECARRRTSAGPLLAALLPRARQLLGSWLPTAVGATPESVGTALGFVERIVAVYSPPVQPPPLPAAALSFAVAAMPPPPPPGAGTHLALLSPECLLDASVALLGRPMVHGYGRELWLRALDLLPPLLRHARACKGVCAKLCDALGGALGHTFPRSYELCAESATTVLGDQATRAQLIRAMQAVLRGLEDARAPETLALLLSQEWFLALLAKGASDKLLGGSLESSLRVPLRAALAACSVRIGGAAGSPPALAAWEACAEAAVDARWPGPHRLGIVREIVVPLLRLAPADVAVELVLKSLPALKQALCAVPGVIDRKEGASPPPGKPAALRAALVDRTHALLLAAAVFEVLDKATVEAQIQPAYAAQPALIGGQAVPAAASNAHSLKVSVIAAANAIKGAPIGDPAAPFDLPQPCAELVAAERAELIDHVREYHAAAFAAMTATVLCTQSKAEAIAKFIMSRGQGPVGVQLYPSFWGWCVPAEAFELDVLVTFSKSRSASRAARSDARKGPELVRAKARSGKLAYLASQLLTNSSLGTEASSYLFGEPLQPGVEGGGAGGFSQPGASQSQADGGGGGGGAGIEAEGPADDDDEEDEGLRLDPINRLPAMEPLVDAIERLAKADSAHAAGAQPPEWMEYLLTHTTPPDSDNGGPDASRARNRRLFICCAVLNRPAIFFRYRAAWAPVLLRATRDALSDPLDPVKAMPVNYLARELLMLLCEWMAPSEPEVGAAAADDDGDLPGGAIGGGDDSEDGDAVRRAQAAARECVVGVNEVAEFMRVGNEVVQKLQKSSYHPEQKVLKHNIKLVRTLLERLTALDRACVQASCLVPMLFMLSSNKDMKAQRQKRRIGFFLLEALLINRLPWCVEPSPPQPVAILPPGAVAKPPPRRPTAGAVCDALLGCVKSDSAPVRRVAACVAGILLKRHALDGGLAAAGDAAADAGWREHVPPAVANLLRGLVDYLYVLLTDGGGKSTVDVFIELLDELSDRFPPILSEQKGFLAQCALVQAGTLHGELRARALRCVLRTAQSWPDSLNTPILSQRLREMASYHAPEPLRLTIAIAALTCKRADDADGAGLKLLGSLLPALEDSAGGHRDAAVRRCYHELLQSAWLRARKHAVAARPAAPRAGGGGTSAKLGELDADTDALRCALLRAQADPDRALRASLLQFWDSQWEYLPGASAQIGVGQRLSAAFVALSAEGAEQAWLSTAANLVLRTGTRESSSYTYAIFSHQLNDAELTEVLTLQAGACAWSQPMQPLFTQPAGVSLVASLSASAGGGGARGGPLARGMIRASQAGGVAWTQTQDGAVVFDGTYSSQMGGGRRGRGARGSQASSCAGAEAPDDDDDGSRGEIAWLRAPFSRDTGFGEIQSSRRTRAPDGEADGAHGLDRTASAYQGDKWSLRMAARQSRLAAEAMAEASKVTPLRHYKVGELPDITISAADILGPLCELCLADAVLASATLCALLAALRAGAPTALDSEQLRAGVISLLAHAERTPALTRALHELMSADPEPSWVPAETVARTGEQSANVHTAILVLEHALFCRPAATASGSGGGKRAKAGAAAATLADADADSTRLLLAGLHAAAGEIDVPRAVFATEATRAWTCDALALAARANYAGALAKYDQAWAEAATGADECAPAWERGVWAAGRLEALEALGRWPELKAAAADEATQAGAKMGAARALALCAALGPYDKAAEEAVKAAVAATPLLEAELRATLAVSALQHQQLDSARSMLPRCELAFVQAWAGTHPEAHQQLRALLQPLQVVAELGGALAKIADPRALLSAAVATAEPRGPWRHATPSPATDGAPAWAALLRAREAVGDAVLTRALELNRDADAPERDALKARVHAEVCGAQAWLCSQAARATRAQGNFVASKNFLKQWAQVTGKQLTLAYSLAVVRLKLAENASAAAGSGKYASILGSTFQMLEGAFPATEDAERSREWRALAIARGGLLSEQAAGAREHAAAAEAVALERKALAQLELAVRWAGLTVGSLASGGPQVAAYEDDGDDATPLGDALGCAHASLALANFAVSALSRPDDNGGGDARERRAALARTAVERTLFSLRAGAIDAADHVPTLIRLCAVAGDGALDPKLGTALADGLARLPAVWPLLRWAPQLVGELGEARSAQLSLPVLLALAARYPQAVYFQFQLARPTLPAACAAACAPLAAALAAPALQPLLEALEDLTHPELRTKDFLTACVDALKAGDQAQAMALWKKFHSSLLGRTECDGLGTYNAAFTRENAKVMGNLQLMIEKSDVAQLTKLKKNLEPGGDQRSGRGSGALAPNVSLAAFSQWLSAYRREPEIDAEPATALGGGGAPRPVAGLGGLELPGGAYDGRVDPAIRGPDGVCWVESFDGRMETMTSIRKPKCVTVRCSDQLDRKLLVKGGEDLRLDQRLQQLFRTMNRVLERDGACASRGMRVGTYAVLPLSPNVGLIEWLDGTEPLKGLLRREADRDKPHFDLPVAKYRAIYRDSQAYTPSFARKPRETITSEYNKIVDVLPPALLRGALLARAPCAEAFLERRSTFARSLSAQSICTWVVGIGDRHLDNFLVRERTGELIPIDFGHAFGSATFSLPVPELMPFRLTPQLIGVLAPLPSQPLLHAHMVHTLAALRGARAELLRVCEVFVSEPLGEWLKWTGGDESDEGTAGAGGESVAADGESAAASARAEGWVARTRVSIVERKLSGANPAQLTLEDLKSTTHKTVRDHLSVKNWAAVTDIVIGGQGSERSKLPAVGLSAEDQVRALIEQATDPNILGRTWIGWSSYC